MAKIYGMTGFGVGVVETDLLSVRVELRSWNSKGLDVSIKGPFLLVEWESALRDLLLGSKKIKRGLVRADVFVRPKKISYKVNINYGLWQAIEHVAKDMGLNYQMGFSEFLSVPGLVSYEISQPEKALNPLKQAMRSALKSLLEQRAKEGEAMLLAILQALDLVISRYNMINKRISFLDKQGYFQESHHENGYKRKDVFEEIKRLKMNIDMFKKTLNSRGPKGKRLDFIAQELLRESNTLMAKLVDSELTLYSLELKMGVDRIREVVQNVE